MYGRVVIQFVYEFEQGSLICLSREIVIKRDNPGFLTGPSLVTYIDFGGRIISHKYHG
jgi:hypothetical protein